jgi:hypothetical protein
MRYGNSPRQMVELFEDWLACARDRETGAARVDPAIHAHVSGRPLFMAAYERILEIAKGADDIWLGTRSVAVDHLMAALGSK